MNKKVNGNFPNIPQISHIQKYIGDFYTHNFKNYGVNNLTNSECYMSTNSNYNKYDTLNENLCESNSISQSQSGVEPSASTFIPLLNGWGKKIKEKKNILIPDFTMRLKSGAPRYERGRKNDSFRLKNRID